MNTLTELKDFLKKQNIDILYFDGARLRTSIGNFGLCQEQFSQDGKYFSKEEFKKFIKSLEKE